MSTICRTCLQKSNTTFKTNQTLGDFGSGDVKISIVLRFCMPELYLGLSSNPEICYDCKESLKIVYTFKKKCLSTENIIGNFLKNARCTARSVELHDVLAFFKEQAKLQLEVEKAKERINLNAQDIISEWEETADDALAVDKGSAILEVRQSAPNPTNSQTNKNKLKFCEETGLFVDQAGQFFDSSGNAVDKHQVQLNNILNHKEATVDNEVTKDHPDFVHNTDNTNNFCKITSVFSLSENVENTDKDPVNEASNANAGPVDIKEEPLDAQVNVDFNDIPTDEDTLDASETGSYENMECPSNLQGIIDNLPDINDINQYVDVPEFVQINNFGLKELEELRRQQQKDGKNEPKKYVLDFKNKVPIGALKPSLEPANLSEKETKTDESKKEEPFREGVAKVPLSTLPEILFINGKKMMKCKDGYRLSNDPASEPIQILSTVRKVVKNTNIATQENAPKNKKFYSIVPEEYFNKHFKKGGDLENSTVIKPYPEVAPELFKYVSTEPPNVAGKGQDSEKISISDSPNVQSGANMNVEKEVPDNANIQEPIMIPKKLNTVDSVPKLVGRRRKKIKIVPVNDKYKYCSQKGARLDLKIQPFRTKPIRPLLKEDKEVVVLFTNYTLEGEYINDHDYLINPYKRNKVLIEEENQWYCMCYICNSKHDVYDHVSHMKMHLSKCKICLVDLGTPYMLNVHVKAHTKPCRQCTERIPYGEIESHDAKHLRDEINYERVSKKRMHHLRNRRKRSYIEDPPVSFPIKKSKAEPEREEVLQPEEQEKMYVPDYKSDSEGESSNTDEWGVTGSKRKKRRKRRRKQTNNEENVVVERSSRVLRSNVRKSYSETESEDLISDMNIIRTSLLQAISDQ